MEIRTARRRLQPVPVQQRIRFPAENFLSQLILANLSKRFTAGSICLRFGTRCLNPRTTKSSSVPSKSSPRCATKAPRLWPTNYNQSSSTCPGQKGSGNERNTSTKAGFPREADAGGLSGLCAEVRRRDRLCGHLSQCLAWPGGRREVRLCSVGGRLVCRRAPYPDL